MKSLYTLTPNNIHDLWGNRTIRCEGEPLEEPIFTAVGRALTAWENADEVLVNIYGSFFTSNQFEIKKSYGMETNFRRRLNEFETAYERFLQSNPQHQNLHNLVSSLKNHFIAGNIVRSDIAHGVVRPFGSGNSQTFLLIPTEWNFGKLAPYETGAGSSESMGAHTTMYFYNSKVINEYADKFDSLRGAGNLLLGLIGRETAS